VHGNLHALEAVLRVLSRAGVDEYLCAGDLVGYGPMPNECIATLADIDATCVAGNHDLIALGQLSDGGCSQLARESLSWTQDALNDDSLTFLEQLPRLLRTSTGVVLAHGALDDPTEYVLDAEQRSAQLRQLERDHPGASLLILGHTHHPVAFGEVRGLLRSRWLGRCELHSGEKCLLNPGSVGQAREQRARARFMVLDVEENGAIFRATRYDSRGCRRALRERGRPTWSCHLTRDPIRSRASAIRRTLTRQ
jgi:predicted phosphodiesterase